MQQKIILVLSNLNTKQCSQERVRGLGEDLNETYSDTISFGTSFLDQDENCILNISTLTDSFGKKKIQMPRGRISLYSIKLFKKKKIPRIKKEGALTFTCKNQDPGNTTLFKLYFTPKSVKKQTVFLQNYCAIIQLSTGQ